MSAYFIHEEMNKKANAEENEKWNEDNLFRVATWNWILSSMLMICPEVHIPL